MNNDILSKTFGSWYSPMINWKIFDQKFNNIIVELNKLYKEKTIYPSKGKVFRVFRETPYNNLKVVMLFQDPYHDGSATGIAAGNENADPDKPSSPTLRIMMKEWQEDPATGEVFHESLLPWCRQGVLMLNCALTVEEGEPLSHMHLWKLWTEHLLVSLTMEKQDLVFILLGKKAQAWKHHIINGRVVYAPHPAAEVYAGGTAGFYGSRIFTRANDLLKKAGKTPVIW